MSHTFSVRHALLCENLMTQIIVIQTRSDTALQMRQLLTFNTQIHLKRLNFITKYFVCVHKAFTSTLKTWKEWKHPVSELSETEKGKKRLRTFIIIFMPADVKIV